MSYFFSFSESIYFSFHWELGYVLFGKVTNKAPMAFSSLTNLFAVELQKLMNDEQPFSLKPKLTSVSGYLY
jgi:hypothetical protein